MRPENGDDPVLAQLKEMRGEFRELGVQVSSFGHKLHRLELSIENFESRNSHAIHLAGVANAQAQLAEKKADLALEQQRRLSADIERLRAKLGGD